MTWGNQIRVAVQIYMARILKKDKYTIKQSILFKSVPLGYFHEDKEE